MGPQAMAPGECSSRCASASRGVCSGRSELAPARDRGVLAPKCASRPFAA